MSTNAREISVGLKVNTGTWGTGTPTAVAVGAGNGYYVRDDVSGFVDQEQLSPNDSAGQTFITTVGTGFTEHPQFQLPVLMHYDDAWMNPLYALALGSASTPSQQGMTTVYDAQITPIADKTGVMATVVIDKEQDIFECPAAKCTGFEISSGSMGRIEGTFNFIGSEITDASTTNTATEISALTYHSAGLRMFLHQAVLRVNDQTAGALDANDAIKISDFRLSWNQPLDTRHAAGQTIGIEPEESGFPTCTLEVTAADYDATNNAFWADHRAGTYHKADLVFTGPTISGEAVPYTVTFHFPNLLLQRTPDIPIPSDGGRLVPSFGWNAYGATSAPTGMSGITAPVVIDTDGVGTANALA